MQWQNKAGNITTNIKVKIYFTLPEFSATEIVAWEYHVDDPTKGRCNIMPVRYLLVPLGLNVKFFELLIETGDVPLNVFIEPMIDLGTQKFKYLNTGNFIPEKYFTNS